MQYAVESGGNVIAGLHGTTSGTPSSSIIMTEAEFDSFLAWVMRVKGMAVVGNTLTELVRQLKANGTSPA